MLCPVCTDVTLVISSREGVEIDHCPQCRGVWLDRGELDKIIDRVEAVAPARARIEPERRERDDERRDRSARKKRRSSFLEELFDFD